MLSKLAWRSIWRNRRRSLITMASIVFAVILCVLMDSVKKGLLDRMKENIVGIYSGHAQVHQHGYWDERTLENSFAIRPTFAENLLDQEFVRSAIPRLESFILAASDQFVKGTMILGVDTEQEAMVTNLDEKVINGHYLLPDDEQVLVTEGLANYLQLDVGDTIVFLGQGYHGVSAVAQYRIKGLVKFGSPDLNEGLVYLPLKESQRLFGAPDRLTAMVLMLSDIDKSSKVAQQVSEYVGSDYEVMSWQRMSPELDQFIRGEEAENVIFQIILYMLIGFGIFGTILMMTLEREREFGIMVAIGMKKWALSVMVILENWMIAILGAVGGMLLSFPITYYFYKYPISLGGDLAEAYENFGIEPIFYFSIEPVIFYTQALIVLALASLLSLFPLLKIHFLNPVDAMRK